MSLGLTFGVLWLLETLDSSVRSRRDLFDLTGVAPLALIPHIGTSAEQRAVKRRVWIAAGSAAAVLCMAVVLAHFFYKPLDVIWFGFAHRLGF
jgi:protein tyrosine kinase modulator